MTNFEEKRPRRAMAPDDPADEFPHDDTPAETSAARRYAESQDGNQDFSENDETDKTPDEEPPAEADASVAEPEETLPETPASPGGSLEEGLFRESAEVNPFARPGSTAASVPIDTPIPRPVLPTSEPEDAGETTYGRHMGGVAVGPTPAPRRSADSSLTPPEPEASPDPASTPPSWFEHHRRTLLIWAIGVLIVALLLVIGISYFRQNSAGPVESPTPTSQPTETPTPTEPPPPEAAVEDLLTPDDAALIVDGASWVVTNTATERSEFPARPVCLSTDVSTANPLIALQQTLGTSQEDQLAALHQIEVFATPEAAQDLMWERIGALSACSGLPAYHVNTNSVQGIGDGARAFTIAYQNDPAEYHTLLMVRNGRALSMLDVVRHGEQVPVQELTLGIQRSLDSICEASDGQCPSDGVTVSETLPLPGDPAGWLEPWDVPRVRAGQGMWTVGPPSQVSLAGTVCDNIPLATEPGPSDRAQRTYIITQDAEAHEAFGIDEVLFSFADANGAQEFADQLIENNDGCDDRVLAAEVTEIGTVEGTGADDAAVSAKTYLIELETADDATVRFQIAIGAGGTKAVYLLAVVTEDYRFTDEQWNTIALRAAQRATQA